jgi:hypothetical protein
MLMLMTLSVSTTHKITSQWSKYQIKKYKETSTKENTEKEKKLQYKKN